MNGDLNGEKIGKSEKVRRRKVSFWRKRGRGDRF